MTQDDWRSDAANAYLEDLSLAGLCWELLRRNESYRADWADTRIREVPSADPDRATGGRAHAWGLTFLRRPRANLAPAADLLAA